MNRRTKERLDLQLLCRIGARTVLSTPSGRQAAKVRGIGLTENLSRSGLLMKWLDAVALPEIGAELTVDIDLPVDEAFGPRAMRCQATVVRIIRTGRTAPVVGMRIGNIRVITPSLPDAETEPQPAPWALELMAPANTRPI
jgi:hypothetical protein